MYDQDDKNFIRVLDHGFVYLKDIMGTDSSITQAARLSYGDGTKSVREDRALIRYLMRMHHSSPFEQCEVKYHIRLPIFVARQLIRHRTACLTGDVMLTFDEPAAIEKGRRKARHMSVEQVFERFRPTKGEQGNPYHKRDRVCEMHLRSCNEETLEPYHTTITDIWENGIKPVRRVVFPNGHVLRATADHLCFTDQGWLRLEDALNSKALFANFERATGFVSEAPSFTHGSGYARTNASDRMDTGCDQKLCMRYIAPLSWQDDGEEMTYDLSVAGPFHNFSAGNIVVHNSVNEYSARYSILSDEFYMPEPDIIQPQSTGNRQGRSGDIADVSRKGVQWLMQTTGETTYDIYRMLLGERTGRDPDYPEELIYDPYSEVNPLLDDEFPGIARELARTVLPVSYYTEVYWKTDLKNLFDMLKLRTDQHAQYEIRVFAEAMYTLLKPKFPLACEAYQDYLRDAMHLSRMEVDLLTALLHGTTTIETIDPTAWGMSKREMSEFIEAFGLSK